MDKKTVRRNYAFLVILAIIMSVVVIGAFGIFTIWDKTNKDVVTIMNLTAEAEAAEMDMILLKVKDVGDTVGAYIGARIASTDMHEAAAVEAAGLDEEIQELFLSSVDHLEGTVGYYVIYSDAYNSSVNGFAYRKNSSEDDSYYSMDIDSLQTVDASGEIADWFDLAVSSQQPAWIPIRESSYTDGYIFSYIVPIYCDKELVGAACVDVDFEVLAKPVRDIAPFENGYAYLTDDKGKVLYHPLIGYGVLLTEDEDEVPEVDSALGDTSNHGELINYEYKGQKKKMAFQALLNDMRLVITANVEDVERETGILIRNIILSGIGIMAVFMFLALMLEKWTMHPALDKMDLLAHIDGLTGAQNRTSFLEQMAELNKKIQDGKSDFGFVMFDANNLKMINDQHGHKMGDIYLLSIVEMIRECYPGYPLFRIGGDEFVVLAEGMDALKASEHHLDLTYTWQKKRAEENKEIWEKPSVAAAFAAYDPKKHNTAEEVLAEADKLMYQKKQQMKARNDVNKEGTDE